METPSPTRPQQVDIAIKLLYAMLVIGVLMTVMLIPEISSSARTENGQASMDPATLTIVFSILMFAIFGLYYFLVLKIGKGRNWARITFLVLFVAYMPVYIPSFIHRLEAAPASAMVGLVVNIVQAVALVLLFQKASSDWFKETKA